MLSRFTQYFILADINESGDVDYVEVRRVRSKRTCNMVLLSQLVRLVNERLKLGVEAEKIRDILGEVDDDNTRTLRLREFYNFFCILEDVIDGYVPETAAAKYVWLGLCMHAQEPFVLLLCYICCVGLLTYPLHCIYSLN